MMLKFLTHKLRTQTLNDQEPYLYKNEEEEHDSGTESDGEAEDQQHRAAGMESEAEHSAPASPAASTTSSGTEVAAALAAANGGGAGGAINCPPIAVSPYFLDSALPSDSDLNYDHHSSEEELEVINSQVNVSRRHHHHHHHHRKHSSVPATLAATPTSTGEALTASATVPAARDSNSYPEKRKWSQMTPSGGAGVSSCSPDSLLSPVSCGSRSSTRIVSAAGESSSDEEVQGLLAAMATPVEFRTSPPLDAHKPGHKPVVRSLSPPSKYFHYSPPPLTASASASALEASPRKRHHRAGRAHHIQRPCLDFEKMQQLKARAVTHWRHNSEHGGGGELSVFCW